MIRPFIFSARGGMQLVRDNLLKWDKTIPKNIKKNKKESPKPSFQKTFCDQGIFVRIQEFLDFSGIF